MQTIGFKQLLFMGIIVALLAHKNIQYIIIGSNKAAVVEVAKVVATLPMPYHCITGKSCTTQLM